MGKMTIDIEKYDDSAHEEIAKEVEEFYKDTQELIYARAKDIEYCVRFYEGDQWIEYNKAGKVWTGIRQPKKGPGIPRTTSNKIKPAVETVTSFLAGLYSSLGVEPNSNEEDDKSAAKVGDAIIDYKWDGDREDLQLTKDATWLVVTGNVVRETFWNENLGPIITQPLMQEVAEPVVQSGSVCQNDTCGYVGEPGLDACPHCNASMVDEQQEVTDEFGNVETQTRVVPQIDENGQPLLEEFRYGDVDNDVFSFLNLLYSPEATSHKTSAFLGRTSVVDIEWVRQTYNKEEPGYTGRANEVIEDESFLSSVHQREISLKGITSTKSNFTYTANDLKGKCILKTIFFKPTSRRLRGREIHVANGVLLYVGQYKYFDDEDKNGWHPYSFGYDQPGLGKIQCGSRTLGAIPFQKRLNAIDAVVALHRQTVGMPALLIPSGTQIKDGQITGLPNKIIEWSPSSVHNHEPKYLEGNQLPVQIGAERQLAAQEIMEQIGVTDALMGAPSTNVRSADQYGMMLESSTRRFKGLMDSWRTYIEDAQTKKLRVLATEYREAPPEILQKVLVRHKDISFTDLQNFLSMGLRDNTNIRIEAKSFVPRSQSYEQHQLNNLLQYQAIHVEDPQERQLLFEKFGLKGFGKAENVDVKKAEWENDLMKKGTPLTDNRGEGIPPSLPMDNDEIHLPIHDKQIKSPNFFSYPPLIQQINLAHYEWHINRIRERQEEMLKMMQAEQKEGQAQTPKSKKKK